MADERKDWLTAYMLERSNRASNDLPDVYLYHEGTKEVSFRDFVHCELVYYSNMDNERSIPSLCDGAHLSCFGLLPFCVNFY